MLKHTLLYSSLAIMAGCSGTSSTDSPDIIYNDVAVSFAPRNYICYKSEQPIKIDGDIEGDEWAKAPWTEYFEDIEGEGMPKPLYSTRAKMLWDDTYLYVAAELEEEHVWAYLTERESVIFADNDFEVFIDPDGDTHNYFEFEMNALSTEWDLMLSKPYRDGGPAVNNWNINGIKSAVKVYGTINNGKDKDSKWTLEIAMPLAAFTEFWAPKPQNGSQWRVNFSRVEWLTEFKDGKYVKYPHPHKNKIVEDNWVWSPQGIINMHAPETWGFMQFSDKTIEDQSATFVYDKNEDVKWALRKLYFRQNQYAAEKGEYAKDISLLKPSEITVEGIVFNPRISNTFSEYEIVTDGFDNKEVHIKSDGRVWVTDKK